MKKTLYICIFLLPILLISQNSETIDWITKQAIEIEDAEPDTALDIFTEHTPAAFDNAKIYGFGEASHNTKEFFNLKAKFFKHLVETQDVKTFIMEESYQAEAIINEYISGGEGDIKTVASSFSIGFWRTKEVLNLITWMRTYNLNKPKSEHIRFYGMDVQLATKLNQEIRSFVTAHNLTVDEKLLATADSCANKVIDYSVNDGWWKDQINSLRTLKQQILNLKPDSTVYKATSLRSLDYLISYTTYASLVGKAYPQSTKYRDLQMFENVKHIVNNESQNGKAFVWAHNEHINNRELYSRESGIINLGHHLKDYYNEDYYSVGFGFGTGTIKGFVSDKKEGSHWKTYEILKPFKKTYAHTLFKVEKDIFFIDFKSTLASNPTNFFTKENRHLLIAGGGYQPKPLHRIMINKIYAETYDGFIFIKKISPPESLY